MTPRCLAVPVLLLALAVAAGCGDEASDGGGAVVPEPGRATPAGLLADLSARVADGRGISDGTWTMDVQEVAMALWPDDVSPAALRARVDHTNLAHIAGDLARRMAQDPSVRAQTEAQDPSSLAIHDAFVAASATGPDAYRRWIEDEGHDLLEARVKALTDERPPR